MLFFLIFFGKINKCSDFSGNFKVTLVRFVHEKSNFSLNIPDKSQPRDALGIPSERSECVHARLFWVWRKSALQARKKYSENSPRAPGGSQARQIDWTFLNAELFIVRHKRLGEN